MPDLIITVNSVPADFSKVSQSGYDAVFVETTAGVASADRRRIVTKHTINEKGTKPNRHLISCSRTFTDSAGVQRVVKVHAVIEVPKGTPDALVTAQGGIVSGIVGDSNIIANLLMGILA